MALRSAAAVPRHWEVRRRRRALGWAAAAAHTPPSPPDAAPQGYLAFYLNKYLGQYVEGIDQKQFRYRGGGGCRCPSVARWPPPRAMPAVQ